MKRHVTISLVLVGMILGCAATAVSPVGRSWAQPAAGRWECFVVDRFPDVDDARSWDGARNITAGMNKVAAHVAAGTVLAVTPKSGSGSYPSVTCVKY